MLEIFVAVGIGIVLGVFTGLLPGVHVNLVAVLLMGFSGLLLGYFSPFALVCMIVAMAVVYTFLDALPSTFLGVPDDTVMMAFPAHKLLLQGRGYEAVFLSTTGAFVSLLLALFFVPFLLLVLQPFYTFLVPFLGWVLLFIVLLLFYFGRKRAWALVVFSLSSLLGIITFDLPIKEPLFPLLSGLFGVSSLLFSVTRRVRIPYQVRSKSIPLGESFVVLPVALLAGGFASFMPGLGPAHVASIVTFFSKLSERGYILFMGGLSTVNMVLSLVSLYVLDKARNGAIAAVIRFADINLHELWLLLFVSLLVGSLGFLLTLCLVPGFLLILSKVDYRKLCFGVLCFVSVLVLMVSGWIGLLVLGTGVAIGVFTGMKCVEKSYMMGCLLAPVIVYFLV